MIDFFKSCKSKISYSSKLKIEKLPLTSSNELALYIQIKLTWSDEANLSPAVS